MRGRRQTLIAIAAGVGAIVAWLLLAVSLGVSLVRQQRRATLSI